MKNYRLNRIFTRKNSIALLAAAVLMVSAAAGFAFAKTAGEINASVNASLDRFYKHF
mgnify:CR=1 FL=1